MSRTLTIEGRAVELEWSQRSSRLYVARASKLGQDPLSLMGKPAHRIHAVSAFFWLLLPPAEHAKYDTPADLFAAMSDEEFNSEQAVETLLGLFDDIAPPAEKKSTASNLHLPASNSGSRRTNGKK